MKFLKSKRGILLLILVLAVLWVSGHKYNSVENAKMITPRYNHSSILLDNGNVLLIGGSNQKAAKSAEIYLSEKQQFKSLPDTNFSHAKSFLVKKANKVFIIDKNPIEFFDEDTNQFINLKQCIFKQDCSLPEAKRRYFEVTDFFNDNVIINDKEKLYLYNLRKLQLTEIKGLGNVTKLTALSDKEIVIFKTAASTEISVCNIETSKCKKPLKISKLNKTFKPILLENRTIYILDGIKSYIYKADENTIEELDKYCEYKALYETDAIQFKNKNILIIPGNIDDKTSLKDTYIFDKATKTYTPGANLKYSAKYSSKTLLKDGNILITGGERDINKFNLKEVFLNSDILPSRCSQKYQ